jgi:mono/diheme cytochrome c family protein
MKKATGILHTLSRPIIIASAIAFLGGCRGMTSESPPIHPNPNMDTQAKYIAQRESGFFADGAAMRTPPEGTVARGQLHEDVGYFNGRYEDSTLVAAIPFTVDAAVLKRGAERFDIFCAPCHGVKGDGQGKIMKYKYPIPPNNLMEQRMRDLADGALFEVIANGIRNMPSYRQQIPAEDRWNIVAHVRELQSNSPVAPPASNTTPPQQ